MQTSGAAQGFLMFKSIFIEVKKRGNGVIVRYTLFHKTSFKKMTFYHPIRSLFSPIPKMAWELKTTISDTTYNKGYAGVAPHPSIKKKSFHVNSFCKNLNIKFGPLAIEIFTLVPPCYLTLAPPQRIRTWKLIYLLHNTAKPFILKKKQEIIYRGYFIYLRVPSKLQTYESDMIFQNRS